MKDICLVNNMKKNKVPNLCVRFFVESPKSVGKSLMSLLHGYGVRSVKVHIRRNHRALLRARFSDMTSFVLMKEAFESVKEDENS